MAKKIPIVGVGVTSNISGTVQQLGPMFSGSAVSTNSLQSIVDSKPSIIYADSAELSALISIVNEIIGTVGLILSDTYDAALIQEIVTFIVSKRFSDQVGPISDLITEIIFNKALSSSADQIDILTRTVDFNRAFSDSEILSDKQTINFSKLLTDSANPIDITGVGDGIAFDFSKILVNLVNTSDNFNRVTDFIRKPEDVLTLNDKSLILANKSLKDNVTSDDFRIIDFIKRHFETVDVLEELAIDSHKVLSDVSVIQDLTPLTIVKPFTDLFAVDDFDKIDFTKNNFETILTSDENNVAFTKALIEASQQLDFSVIDVQKILTHSINIVDFDAIDFTKVNIDSVSAESFTVLNTIKFISDLQLTEDETILNFEKNAFDSITADSILRFDFIKFLADIATVEDLTNIFDGSNYIINKTIIDVVNTDEDLSRIVDFNRVFQDNQLANELAAIDFNKILESFAGNNDSLVLNTNLSKTDSIADINDVFDRVVEYDRLFIDEQDQNDLHIIDLTKALADVTSTNDDDILSVTKVLSSELSNISEISTIDFTKFRSDQADTIDLFDRIVSFNRSFTETVLQSDLAALSITKPFSDAIGHVDGPIQFDSDGWAVDYAVSGYIFDTRVVFDVIKALADINPIADNDFYDLAKVLADLIDQQDNDVIDFNKALADANIILLDDDVLDFTKASADLVIQPDGPIQFDSDGWAVDYVVSGYIFDTRVVFDITKPLTDLIDPQDVDVINFVKPFTEELIILDDEVLAFTKPFIEILNSGDGPIQFDSDGWAVDYAVSGYIFDTRPAFNLTKPFTDTVQQPDDLDVFNFNKALADFNDPLDLNIINFIKVLSDNAVPLDNIDVFDGSTYSFYKNINDSFFAEDQNTNVVDFNRAFTDSINSITEAGTVANQNYIADYFLEDYIGESRLIA
jgi:hypothetical protein